MKYRVLNFADKLELLLIEPRGKRCTGDNDGELRIEERRADLKWQ